MQWSEEHERGMLQNIHPDLQRYLDTRHLPAKPSEPLPAQDMQPYKNAGEAVAALIVAVGKPLVALTAVGGVVCVVGAVVVAAVGAVFAFVSTYALYIGGGVFAVACLSGLFAGKSSEEKPVPSTGGHTINVTVNVAGNNVTTNSK